MARTDVSSGVSGGERTVVCVGACPGGWAGAVDLRGSHGLRLKGQTPPSQEWDRQAHRHRRWGCGVVMVLMCREGLVKFS
jgi:hypothetical protein